MVRKGKKGETCTALLPLITPDSFSALMRVLLVSQVLLHTCFVDFCSMYNKTQDKIIGDHYFGTRIPVLNVRLAWKKSPDMLNQPFHI